MTEEEASSEHGLLGGGVERNLDLDRADWRSLGGDSIALEALSLLHALREGASEQFIVDTNALAAVVDAEAEAAVERMVRRRHSGDRKSVV